MKQAASATAALMDNMPVRCVKLKPEQVDPSHVQSAVEAIREGQLVALPTETVYGLAAIPGDAASEERLRRLKGRDAGHPLTYHIASPEDAAALAPQLPPPAQRLAARYWPGPLTIVVKGHDQDTLGLRVPANAFTQQVLAEFERGLLLTSVNRTGEPPLIAPSAMAEQLPEIDLIFDAGPPALAQSSAVVRVVGPEVEILREGTLARDDLLAGASASLLFVCTGNTCRSPMAAALARLRAAEALGVDEDRLLAHGLNVGSAGTMAANGMPASDHAIAAGREAGLDLRSHRSRPARFELLEGTTRVFALTNSHLTSLLGAYPGLAGHAFVLDPDGGDIIDPFGSDMESYRVTRTAIAKALDARWPEIVRWLADVVTTGGQVT